MTNDKVNVDLTSAIKKLTEDKKLRLQKENRNQYRRNRRAENPELRAIELEKAKKYYQDNLEKYRARSRERAKLKRQANPEEVRESEKLKRNKNQEKYREYARNWRLTHLDKSRAYGKESARRRRLVNPEGVRESIRKCREANPEKYKAMAIESTKKWQKANPEKYKKLLENRKLQRMANPDKYRARDSENARKRRQSDPEKYRVYDRERRNKLKLTNPEKVREQDFKKTLREFGLSVLDYNKMVASQNGKCLICGTIPDKSNKIHPRLSIDHDHAKNIVRGLLCHKCNLGIGLFKDNIDFLEAAIIYLRKY